MSTTADPVELHLQQSQDGEADSVLKVRWCVPQASVDLMKVHDAEDVHILIVARQGAREIRWLRPIEQDQAYVTFDRPGTWLLDATLVWNQRLDRGDLRFLVKPSGSGSGQYAVALYDHNRPDHPWWGTQGLQRFALDNVILGAPWSIEITVAERFFAGPPPRVLAWFANLHFGSQPVDQCDLRRRVIFNSLLLLVFLGLGAGVIYGGVLLAPAVASGVAALGRFFGVNLLWIGVGIGGALVLSGLGLLGWHAPELFARLRRSKAMAALGVWWRARNAAANTRFQARKAREREAAKHTWVSFLDDLACEARSASGHRPRQTVALRFRALKAKVCRPYAAK